MRFFRLFFLSLLLFLVPLSVYSKSPLNFKITPISIDYSNNYISVDIKYPNLSSSQVNSSKINKVIKDDVNIFLSSLESDGKASYEDSQNGKFHFFPFNANVTYEVGRNNKNLLSIPVVYYEYTGGAHGLTKMVGYNFNPATGSIVNLSDLFNSNNYLSLIKDTILKDIKSNSDIYFNDSIDHINSLKAFTNFYITETDLIVFFNQYEIAPYSSGIREFKIPLKSLTKYLKPEYI